MLEETPIFYALGGGAYVRNRTYLDAKTDRRLTQNVLASDYRPKSNRQTGRYETEGDLMGQHLQTEQEKFIASVTALFADEGLRADKKRRCSRCGAVMQHIDATFWLYESESGWSVRLPMCSCEETSTSPVRTLKKDAV
jgi:hypothetical protein